MTVEAACLRAGEGVWLPRQTAENRSWLHWGKRLNISGLSSTGAGRCRREGSKQSRRDNCDTVLSREDCRIWAVTVREGDK